MVIIVKYDICLTFFQMIFFVLSTELRSHEIGWEENFPLNNVTLVRGIRLINRQKENEVCYEILIEHA